MAGVGFGGWVYSKLHNKTGGNLSSSYIGAGIAGFIAFLAMYTLLGVLF